jgi:hypothetical protein
MPIKTQPSNTLLQVLGTQNLPLLNNLLLLFVKGFVRLHDMKKLSTSMKKKTPYLNLIKMLLTTKGG